MGIFVIGALLLFGFGTGVNNGDIKLDQKPPYVHIHPAPSHVEYTYPVK